MHGLFSLQARAWSLVGVRIEAGCYSERTCMIDDYHLVVEWDSVAHGKLVLEAAEDSSGWGWVRSGIREEGNNCVVVEDCMLRLLQTLNISLVSLRNMERVDRGVPCGGAIKRQSIADVRFLM